LGHFFAEMDRADEIEGSRTHAEFQLGHFFAEMDRAVLGNLSQIDTESFNWATSSQKWIGLPYMHFWMHLLFQLGHFFAEMDRTQTGFSGKPHG